LICVYLQELGSGGGVVAKAVGRSRDRFLVLSLNFSVTHSFRP